MYSLKEAIGLFSGDATKEGNGGLYCFETSAATALRTNETQGFFACYVFTVVDHINQMLLMEASFLLHTSELSITQIADRLHFADAPSFSKFFSRLKGQSPRAFREQ